MKRIVAFIAAAIAVFGISAALPLSHAAVGSAENNEYITNFKSQNTYSAGQFADVGSQWYAESVKQAYECGLMYGDSENTFNPDGNITNAAVVAIAARLHSIYNTGCENFDGASSPWYKPYMNYAVSNGICDNNINPDDTATRAFFVGVIGNAADKNILMPKNNINDGDLYDVSGWYSNSVYSFYRAGVLSGNDEYGTFAPDNPITRGEVSAILVRLVKPSKRIDVRLKEKIGGTYYIMEDDGSLAAYRQRAVAANLEVLLGKNEKDERWETDKYYINHGATDGIPPETIVIPNEYIDTRYDTFFEEVNIAFKASHVKPELKGEIEIPIYSIKYGSYWPIDGTSYKLSVVNTGGKVDFSSGTIINGDLQLYAEGTSGMAAWTETLTYDSYTGEAQNLINNVPYTPKELDKNEIRKLTDEYYNMPGAKMVLGQVVGMKILIGQLTDWGNTYYITSNSENMYLPTPRDMNNDKQTEYTFVPQDKLKDWCALHMGEYVVAVTFSGIDVPVMMAAVAGYAPEKGEQSVKSWIYDQGNLTIQWKPRKVDYTDKITVYDGSEVAAKR